MDPAPKYTERFELEEAQPLHSQSTSTFVPGDVPKLPPAAASSGEVRAFCSGVLTQRLHLDELTAHTVASRWTSGTGRELREYPVALFKEIFGAEHAWVLCREVGVQRDAEELAISKPKLRRNFAIAMVAIFLVIFGLFNLIGLGLETGLIGGAAPAGLIGLIWGAVELGNRTIPFEANVVATLRRNFDASAAPQQV